MDCALWLNKRKVRHASEIPENLDVASLRGYFLAGSLSEWLCDHGGKAYAKKLARLSADDPGLNEKLAGIFGGKANFGKALNSALREDIAPTNSASGSFAGALSYGALSSGTPRNSFNFARFGSGSYSYAMLTSFGEFWEFLRKWQSGSFGSWTFSMGSFSQWEWLFALYKQWYGGSFTFKLGSLGSFREWEWEWLFKLFGAGSFTTTSFGSFGFGIGFGSFDLFGDLFGLLKGGALGSFDRLKILSSLDEYDRIMFETLMICPLDRFGYGIHNI